MSNLNRKKIISYWWPVTSLNNTLKVRLCLALGRPLLYFFKFLTYYFIEQTVSICYVFYRLSTRLYPWFLFML